METGISTMILLILCSRVVILNGGDFWANGGQNITDIVSSIIIANIFIIIIIQICITAANKQLNELSDDMTRTWAKYKLESNGIAKMLFEMWIIEIS